MTDDPTARALVESFKAHIRRDSLANVNWLIMTQLCDKALLQAKREGRQEELEEVLENLTMRSELRAKLYPLMEDSPNLKGMMKIYQDEADSIIAWVRRRAKELS